MKRIKYIIASVLLMSLLFACKQNEPKTPDTKDMDYPVTFSLAGGNAGNALRAKEIHQSPAASYENERAIENLTVLVFDNDANTNSPAALEMVITDDQITKTNNGNTTDDAYSKSYSFDIKRAGTFHIEVIANGYKQGDETSKKAFIEKVSASPLTYMDFKKIILDKELPTNGQKGFVMVSTDPTKVVITKKADGTADPCTVTNPIKLRRLAARFDVFNKVVGLEISKVTLKNQIAKSYMFTQTALPTGETGTEKSFDKSNGNDKWFNKHAAIAGIYSYENPEAGKTTIELEGSYKSKAWKKTIEFKKDGGDITIQRNHIYRIHLTEHSVDTPDDGGKIPGGGGDVPDEDAGDPGKISYKIEVLDWEMGDTFAYENEDFWDSEQGVYVEYVTTTDPLVVDHNGGKGKIIVKKVVHKGSDNKGPVIYETTLSPDKFTATADTSNPTNGLTLKDDDKTFEVQKGENLDNWYYTIKIKGKDDAKVAPEKLLIKRVINPLMYVCEYNIDPTGKAFMTNNDWKGHGYWFIKKEKGKDKTKEYDGAVDLFKNIKLNDKDYHLPPKDEWCGIVCEDLNGAAKIQFQIKKNTNDNVESVIVNCKKIKMKSDYKCEGNNIAYALRYKFTENGSGEVYTKEENMRTAWKYEFTSSTSSSFRGLKITARCIYEGETLEDISKPEFWAKNTSRDVVRYLPNTGWKYNCDDLPDTTSNIDHWGGNGHFWSSTIDQTGVGDNGKTTCKAWSLFIGGSQCYAGMTKNTGKARTVRLFKGVHPDGAGN